MVDGDYPVPSDDTDLQERMAGTGGTDVHVEILVLAHAMAIGRLEDDGLRAHEQHDTAFPTHLATKLH